MPPGRRPLTYFALLGGMAVAAFLDCRWTCAKVMGPTEAKSSVLSVPSTGSFPRTASRLYEYRPSSPSSRLLLQFPVTLSFFVILETSLLLAPRRLVNRISVPLKSSVFDRLLQRLLVGEFRELQHTALRFGRSLVNLVLDLLLKSLWE